jgi:7,8-dihydro-6-hydroxymethylpterin dimethyltransferase
MNTILSHTESVCPECLARIPAARVMYDGGDVYLEKDCPDHGHFKTIIWRGLPAFTSWVKPKIPTYPKNPFTEVKRGCPYDCGLCAEHKQQSCCVLLEVTQRCDLHCPVCFADAANNPPADLTHEEINAWYERLILAGGPFNIQLSGGEPCVRNDLPEIIKIGRSHGFNFFQLNTNGLRIARDFEYLSALKEAGLSTVFLQFDGTRDEIFKTIRGRELLEKKMAVIENCGKLNIGVVLVPTLVPNVNTDNIGDILRLALANMPTVRGVHFQPVSYFGRYPQGFPEAPTDDMRITIPEVIQSIESQTDGLIQAGTLCPPGGENALCSFHGNYVLMADGALKPLTRHKDDSCCCQPIPAAEGASRSREFVAAHWSSPAPLADLPVISAPSFGEWDVFLERKRTHTFCVSGMAFQDAWTLDLDRLRECYIHTASPDGRLVPFCAYNLTDKYGRSLYRNTILKVEGQKLQVGD